LNEPWDSEHNKKLAETRIKTYTLPLSKEEPAGITHYRALVGGGAMVELNKEVRFAVVTAVLSNTLMVVEAKEGVPWTKPDEVDYAPPKLPAIGYFKNGFNGLLGDGSVRWIKPTIDPKVLHALITRAGGEVIQQLDR